MTTDICDWCEYNGDICPGIREHCKRGEHCIGIDSTCALDSSSQDHKSTCCFCKGELNADLSRPRN